MFTQCFFSSAKKRQKTDEEEQDQTIEKRIEFGEIKMLEHIFDDIACRSPEPTLSYHHFITFLSLSGLWGDKLFQYFSMNKNGKINRKQFLYGMARTIRAPFEEKIKILFNFFVDEEQQGIRYSQFLKMLYHCSKQQLKELLISDGVFVQEELIPCTTELKQKEGEVIHLKMEKENSTNSKSTFEQAYENIIGKSGDPGTMIKVKMETYTYQINYCNMLNMTKEFAKFVFDKYGIKKDGSMNFEQFKKWTKNNTSLFDNYFAAFHEEVWGKTKGKFNFLKNIDKECEVQLRENEKNNKVWMMLVGSAIVFALSQKEKQKIIKLVWLYELNIQKIPNQKQHGILMKHASESYFHTIIIFKRKDTLQLWLEELKVFEKNYLHAKYEIDQIIGTGKFSTVYRCRCRQKNKLFALKVVGLEKLDKRDQLAIQNQTQILKVLKSPAIVKYYETIYSRHHIYVVTEYIPGMDLFEYVKKNKRLTEYEAALILGQIIQAVLHLHSLDIIHRDLKPENVMIVKEVGGQMDKGEENKIDKIKLIDFGFANYISALQKQTVERVGTVNYIAPEILLGEKPTFQNDVFALGSILYFMLRGKYTFDSPEMGGTALRTVQGDYSLCDQVWQKVSEEGKDLIQMLLVVDPLKRITLNEAINHCWFSIAKNQKHHSLL